MTQQPAASLQAIFANLTNPGDIAVITETNLLDLESLSISGTAKARITQAVKQGKGIVTPTSMVLFNGKPTITWLETDLQTGHTLNVMEDGGHEAALDYRIALFLLFVPLTVEGTLLQGIGTLVGFGVTALNFIANVLDIDSKRPFQKYATKQAKAEAVALVKKLARSFVLRNGSTRIETAIVNNLDVPLPANAVVTIKRPDGTVQYQSPSPTAINIGGNTAFNNFALDAITATGWADGFYTVELRLLNQNNQPIPGGQGTGKLGVGTPLKASVSADPIAVPPGNSIVATNINIEPKVVGIGGSIGLTPTDPSKDRINWAAASRGTTISGGRLWWSDFPLSKLNDEVETGNDAQRWVYTEWRNNESITVDLSAVRTIDIIQLQLYDRIRDNRFFGYRIESSLDGSLFSTVADKTTGEYRGVQRLVFTATPMRYIKITGTFGSADNYFFLTDEILALGDDTTSPVPTQTVTINGQGNSGVGYTVGQKVALNAGIYEVKHVGGAVSGFATDSDNSGRAWEVRIDTTVPIINKTYQLGFVHDVLSRFATANEAETATLGKSFKLYLPVHADVYFWFSESNPADNRGSETVEIRQISGPNDSLLVRVQDAMTRSVLWEQQEVAGWNGFGNNKWIELPNYDCFGCHVQTQGSAGLAVSEQKLPDLLVDPGLQSKFVDAYIGWQRENGSITGGSAFVTQISLGAWAMSYFSGPLLERVGSTLTRALDWLRPRQQANGGWNADDGASTLYLDGTPSATHTAGNIQALAKAISFYAQQKVAPLANISINSNRVTAQKNPGNSLDILFPPIPGVTGIKLKVFGSFENSYETFVIIGLNAALPYLNGAGVPAARARMAEADEYLRSIQKPEGGWVEVGNNAPNALYSAQALEALVLVAQSSIDPAILAGTEYLLQAQLGKGSWKAP